MRGAASLDDDGAEEAVAALGALVAQAVQGVGALGLVGRDHPLVGDAGARPGNRIFMAGGGEDAGGGQVEGRLVDVDAYWLAVLQVVSQRDAQAVSLVDAQ